MQASIRWWPRRASATTAPSWRCCARSSIASASRSTARCRSCGTRPTSAGRRSTPARIATMPSSFCGTDLRRRWRMPAAPRCRRRISSRQQRTRAVQPLGATSTCRSSPGFRVEANVKRAKAAARRRRWCTIRQQRKDTALAVARAYWSVRRLALLRDVQRRRSQRMVDAEAVAGGARARRAGAAHRRTARRCAACSRWRRSPISTGRPARGGGAARRGARRRPTSWSWSTTPQRARRGAAAPVDSCSTTRTAIGPSCRSRGCRSRRSTRSVRMARSNFYPQLDAVRRCSSTATTRSTSAPARARCRRRANPFADLSRQPHARRDADDELLRHAQHLDGDERRALSRRSRLQRGARRVQRARRRRRAHGARATCCTCTRGARRCRRRARWRATT